nr:SRPBCC family protein [Kibdelosporangium sp. MJ126-NF4]
MLSFHGDERRRSAQSDDEEQRLAETHFEYRFTVLERRAKVVFGRALEPLAMTRTVLPGNRVVQGPATPETHALAGYYVIECEDLDTAVDIARQFPGLDDHSAIEVRQISPTWDNQILDSSASRAAIWRLYQDVSSWNRWKAGVRDARLDGPFTAGATGELVVDGRPPMPLRLVEVVDGESYVSQTVLSEGMELRMEHTLTSLPGGGTRIVHRATVPMGIFAVFGLAFGPRFNTGVRKSMTALSELAEAGGKQ